MEAPVPSTSKTSSPESPVIGAPRVRLTRTRKRRRLSSETSSDAEPVLPENTLEVEKNLQASAIKNNLDDVSVKKILKKVVTNDHVLALVKLREEEENMATEEDDIKLTRSRVKKLKTVSARKIESMALTPIKHIPVKTRPEVTALIDQDLPEDEDDDEYEPTNDDVPSDDDQTLESCSDVDSQPRTPATPRRTASPRALRDGPFKIPQVSTPRRPLDMEEDATIALRTRSKLSLSSIPIDHIESSFVPPDDLPVLATDDVWTEFLQDCLNPEAEKEADDEDDPEYNVHADPDSNDEDEECVIKISRKELDDLVNELMHVMPDDDPVTGKLASKVPAQNNEQISTSHWVCKQEPLSDDETPTAQAVQSEERRLSIGKTEPLSDGECQESEKENQDGQSNNTGKTPPAQPKQPSKVTVSVVERSVNAYTEPTEAGPVPPALLQGLLETQNTVTIQVEQGAKILPEQIEILQQQLRQHIQLATSNYLQLYVHPLHWGKAPIYKEYLETLDKITTDNPKSVANVCNLKPALDLVNSWEKSVSEDTPENAKMVEFIQKEIERSRRRASQNALYVGDFHPTFLNVVANSPVFLYPHLLPPLPYRCDSTRRFSYMRCEDELYTLALDEFWQYVEDNPELYKPKIVHNTDRWGLVTTVGLVCKYMLPWLPPRALLGHIQHVRKNRSLDADNPINKFFASREVTPVKHVLLPFNPNITLYEQPEYELPRVWVKHLSKSSRRFRDYLYRRTGLNKVTGQPSAGVPVELGVSVQAPTKKPLPINFTRRKIANTRLNILPAKPPIETQDKYDIDVDPPPTTSKNLVFGVVQTPSGSYLIPLMQTNTVASASTPICSAEVKETVASNLPEPSNVPTFSVTVPIRNYVPVVNSEAAVTGEADPTVEKESNSEVTSNKEPLVPWTNVLNGRMLEITPLTGETVAKTGEKVSNSEGVSNKDQPVPWANIPNSRVLEITPLTTATNSDDVTTTREKVTKTGENVSNGEGVSNKDQSVPWTNIPNSRLLEITPLTTVTNSEEAETGDKVTNSEMTSNKDLAPWTHDKNSRMLEITPIINHCTCCLQLRKKIRQRQSLITEFIKSPKETPCPCQEKRTLQYPRVSKKLKLLVNNFKCKSNRTLQALAQRIIALKKELREGVKSSFEPEEYTLEEIAAVTTFQLKLIVRLSVARDNFMKRKINTMLSNFDPGTDDPCGLMGTLEKALKIECVDVYKEFLGFLTSEQADEMGKFPDYFKQNCLEDLVNKVEELVPNKHHKELILSRILRTFTAASVPSEDACALCTRILETCGRYPALAEYVFSLFPHKRDRMAKNEEHIRVYDKKRKSKEFEQAQQATDNINQRVDPVATDNTENAAADPHNTDIIESETTEPLAANVRNETAAPPATDAAENVITDPGSTDNMNETERNKSQLMDYEADQSDSDDDGSIDNLTIVEDPEELNQTQVSNIQNDESVAGDVSDAPNLTVTKIEVQDCSESDMSIMVMSDDDIKTEPAEWKRDEDKLLLEVLQESLTPDEIKDKTILEIVEQKKVLRVAAQNLPQKTIDDVRERMLYLLKFLVLNEQ